GRRRDDAIHVGMSARLEHQRLSDVVEIVLGVAALLEDRGARQLWIALDDDADGLAGGVHLDGAIGAVCHSGPGSWPPQDRRGGGGWVVTAVAALKPKSPSGRNTSTMASSENTAASL